MAGIDFENNRDLARQIAGNQPSTPSPRLADWLNIERNLNTRYPVLPSPNSDMGSITRKDVDQLIGIALLRGERIGELKTEVADKDKVIAQLTTDKKSLETRNSELASKVTSQTEVITQLAGDKRKLESRNSELTTKVTSQTEVITQLAGDKRRLEARNSELSSKIASQERIVTLLSSEKKLLELRNSGLNSRVNKLTGTVAGQREEVKKSENPPLNLDFKTLMRDVEILEQEEKAAQDAKKKKIDSSNLDFQALLKGAELYRQEKAEKAKKAAILQTSKPATPTFVQKIKKLIRW